MHQVKVGTAIPFQFEVFEADEYTLKTGLSNSDFEKQVWKNNTVQAVSVTIAELASTGIYGGTVTFPTPGKWRLAVAYPAGTQRFAEDYTVVKATSDDLPQGRALL